MMIRQFEGCILLFLQRELEKKPSVDDFHYGMPAIETCRLVASNTLGSDRLVDFQTSISRFSPCALVTFRPLFPAGT
jgi:hypothetical protein